MLGAGVHTEHDISITKSLTLRGQGTTSSVLQAAATVSSTVTLHLFNVANGVSANFRDMTLRHASSLLGDGAVITGGTGTNIVIERVAVVESATASTGFGGLVKSNGAITVNQSTFRDNITSSPALRLTGVLTLTDSLFENNVGGPGVQLDGSVASVITRCTIRGNGGGIVTFAPLNVVASTISGNIAARGAGIQGAAGVRIVVSNSTITNNFAEMFEGGGVYVLTRGTLVLDNDTIVGNQSLLEGGGLFSNGAVILKNTILANNRSRLGSDDCFGNIHSEGFNLIGSQASCVTDSDADNLYELDPLLGGLSDNGGTTETRTPLPGSPVIDTGDCRDSAGNALSSDQRGSPRPAGAGCDIGAVELEARAQSLSNPAPADAPVEPLPAAANDNGGCSVSNALPARQDGGLALIGLLAAALLRRVRRSRSDAAHAGHAPSVPTAEHRQQQHR